MNKEERKQEREFQDRLMDELLKNAAMEVVKREVERFPKEEDCEYEPSQKFKSAMEKLLKQSEKRARWGEHQKAITKMVASMVVVGIVASTTIMNVEAFRVPIFNFFMEQKEKYSKLEIKEEGKQEQLEYNYDVLLKQYPGLALPMEVPEGYQYGGTKGAQARYITVYNNMYENKIVLLQSFGGAICDIDLEETEVENIDINGIACKIFYSNSLITLVWEKNNYIYNLSGEVSKKELKKIMKSIYYPNIK